MANSAAEYIRTVESLVAEELGDPHAYLTISEKITVGSHYRVGSPISYVVEKIINERPHDDRD